MEVCDCDRIDEEHCECPVTTSHGVNVKVTPERKSPRTETQPPTHGRSLSLPDGRSPRPKSSNVKKGLSLDSRCRSVWVQGLQSQQKAAKYKYGWWCLTPSFLQPIFNNARAFVFLVTLANVLQGMIVNGLLKVNVTSIERRYKLLSSESGLVISSYDIAGCLCLLPISYIGGRGHKPRWISIGVLMLGLGSFILAMPRFLAGRYEYDSIFSGSAQDVHSGLCRRDIDVSNSSNGTQLFDGIDPCDGTHPKSDAYLKQMKYVFILGQFLNGIGNTPLSVLAVTFIDESVDKRVYPIYIGIYYLGALLGPAFGFVLGGQLLTVFTNFGEKPDDIVPESPKWVGAWWVGFIVAGTLTIILSIPLFGYPRKLSPRPRRRKGVGCCYTAWWRGNKHDSDDITNSEMTGKYYSKSDPESSFHLALEEMESEPMVHQQQIQTREETIEAMNPRSTSSSLIKKFFRDILEVISNRAFMFLSLSAAIYSTLVSGFSTFGPKFIESQLGKSAADAANLFGYVCIPAAAGGMLIGAFLMSGLKMNHKSALKMCIAVSLCGLLGHFVLVLNCEDLDLAGVTAPYNNLNVGVSDGVFDNLSLAGTCNGDCACPANARFNPVCGENNITYFSPCHAGCSILDAMGEKVFKNCSCVSSELGVDFVKSGICTKTCQWQTLILFSLFIVILSTFVCTVPGVDLSLRCFPYRQRSLAIGIQWVLIRTLGSIPGPIIFGAMIDSTCLLWGETMCNGEKGSCLLYKNSELSSSFLVLSVIYKVAGIITLCLALAYIEKDTSQCSSPMQNTKKIVELPMSSTQPNQQSTSSLHSHDPMHITALKG